MSGRADSARNAKAMVASDVSVDPGVARFVRALREGASTSNDIRALREAAVNARLSARAGEILTSALPNAKSVRLPAAGEDLTALSFNSERGRGLIVYFHGGGWSLLNAQTHAPIMQRLATSADAMVLGPDVPLAPETPFPTLLSACVSLVETVRSASDVQERVAEGLILAGDSSGANLALATALCLRDSGKPMPDGLILAYGVVDCDLTRASYDLYSGPAYPLSAERMDLFWSFYCRDEADRGNALASPLRADLKALPPTRVIIAEQDVLRDENIELVAKLRSAGVKVSDERIASATHAFWEACLHSALSAASIDAAGTWARQTLRLKTKSSGPGGET